MYPHPDRQRPAVMALYETTWPGLPALIDRARSLGWVWEDISTPFIAWEGDDAVSHVGVLTVPMRVAGTHQAWGAIHAVCTRPERRGQGLNRPLMERALAHIERLGLAGAMLTTEDPALYTRYGFQIIEEHHFTVPTPPGRGQKAPARKLGEREEDVAFLRHALQHRLPLSDRWAPRDSGWLTALCEILYHGGIETFYAIDALGAAVSFQRTAERLDLLAVAAPVQINLAQLCMHIPGTYSEVRLLFCPDRIAPDAQAISAPSPDGTFFLVRGGWPPGDVPIAMPQLSRS